MEIKNENNETFLGIVLLPVFLIIFVAVFLIYDNYETFKKFSDDHIKYLEQDFYEHFKMDIHNKVHHVDNIIKFETQEYKREL